MSIHRHKKFHVPCSMPHILSGFTLVEMIVAVMVIGLLMTVSVVQFQSGRQDDALRSAAIRISDALRTSQTAAGLSFLPILIMMRCMITQKTLPFGAFHLIRTAQTLLFLKKSKKQKQMPQLQILHQRQPHSSARRRES